MTIEEDKLQKKEEAEVKAEMKPEKEQMPIKTFDDYKRKRERDSRSGK